MNISPVSFGKTVKLTSDHNKAAERVADLINGKKAKTKEKEAQRQLQKYFDDVAISPARAVEICTNDIDNPNAYYIVTGEASKQINKILGPYDFMAEQVKLEYGENSIQFFDLDEHYDQYSDAIGEVILDTDDSVVLDVKYDDSKKEVQQISFIV